MSERYLPGVFHSFRDGKVCGSHLEDHNLVAGDLAEHTSSRLDELEI